MNPLFLVLIGGLGLILVVGLGVEWQFRQRQGNLLEIDHGQWQSDLSASDRYRLKGEFQAINYTQNLDVFLTEVKVEVTLLSKASLAEVQTEIQVRSRHAQEPARLDNYWEAYIVKGKQHTGLEVEFTLSGVDLSPLRSAWVRIHYVVYGPAGRIPKVRHCILPLSYPKAAEVQWQATPAAQVLPIPTHLLSVQDDLIEVIKRYVSPHAQPGDIVTIGETPVAIMQGRWRHPSEIRPGWLAKRLCYYFLRTSSLATACGLQSLVDEVGAWRVAVAFGGGAIAKLFGQPGMFYNLAGEQARLVDDVTGTLPPYDQFIVLGPQNSQALVDQIRAETGLEAAIVDVNDLKKVAVLAKTPGTELTVLHQALLDNPAGNAAQQTPLVLIRPVDTRRH
ncbi:MAG: F420-0:Gamma-glutamyl ligase [Pseudanabaenaceae cyanobacterium bins.68]|nr:F420-0:Gamma-glutamyl ligase [Pseudanabaenaceae cyanobacterium bins.68]